MGKLLLLFIVVPAAELYVLITMGRVMGIIPTILLVFLTALAGAALAKLQGLATMLRIRETLAQGFMPAEELLDGLLILVSGICLITPGFLTDIAALLMLLPGPRNVFKRWLRKKFDQWRQSPDVHIRFDR